MTTIDPHGQQDPIPGVFLPDPDSTSEDHEQRIHQLERQVLDVFTGLKIAAYLYFPMPGFVAGRATAPRRAPLSGIITQVDFDARVAPTIDPLTFRFRKNGSIVGPLFTVPVGSARESFAPGTLASQTFTVDYDQWQCEVTSGVVGASDVTMRLRIVGTQEIQPG